MFLDPFFYFLLFTFFVGTFLATLVLIYSKLLSGRFSSYLEDNLSTYLCSEMGVFFRCYHLPFRTTNLSIQHTTYLLIILSNPGVGYKKTSGEEDRYGRSEGEYLPFTVVQFRALCAEISQPINHTGWCGADWKIGK